MGKIIKDKYPELGEEDQEAVRQHAIAALNLTQQAKKALNSGDTGQGSVNTALIDGVRKFAMDVRDLDIDLIDRINPFSEAYAILAKAMNENSSNKWLQLSQLRRLILLLKRRENSPNVL